MSAPPVLAARGVTKRYPRGGGVEGACLEVGAGEVVALMGPSGCGKSTLLRCLVRLVEPDGGDIVLLGRSLQELAAPALRALRRQVGVVFQHDQLIHHLTALENVAMGPLYAGCPPSQARGRAEAALARVGLEAVGKRLPGELSGGERQRVAIARALAQSPQLMLWDEPTASLDPAAVGEVLAVMEDLAHSGGTAVLVVTHQVDFARRVAGRVLLMDRGRIVEEGPPGQVLSGSRLWPGLRYRLAGA